MDLSPRQQALVCTLAIVAAMLIHVIAEFS